MNRIKIKTPILITEEDILCLDDIIIARQQNNLEAKIRDKFIGIIKKNTSDGSVVKLVDLKNDYQDKLDSVLSEANIDITQILKNSIGSNKDNKTHLVRHKNLDWYYIDPSQVKENTFTPCEQDRKPIPLPEELERSKIKKYYMYYTFDYDDSPIVEIINGKKENIISYDTDYISMDFSKIIKSKVDYIEKQKKSLKIGEIGEKYIYNLEVKLCEKLGIQKQVIWVSKENDKYGFDILSYRKNPDGTINRVFIEVKTTTGGLSSKFFVSENEHKISLKYKDNYYIYRVYNSSDLKTIDHELFEGGFDNPAFRKIKIEKTFLYEVCT